MRILLIEDEIDMARYLSAGLQEAGYQVTHCADAQSGLRLAQEQAWDLLIVDRMLPDEQEGLTIIKTLRQAHIATPVLVLSALASLDERVRGLREGADDYLTKPFALPELLARLEALSRRAGVQEYSPLLNVAEFRLLEYLIRTQGQVVTRSMLLKDVWDIHFDPGTNVIDVQISRLRNKVDKGYHPPLLHTIRGIGYRFGIHE